MPLGNFDADQEAVWHEQRLQCLAAHLAGCEPRERNRVLELWEGQGKTELVAELRLRMAAMRQR